MEEDATLLSMSIGIVKGPLPNKGGVGVKEDRVTITGEGDGVRLPLPLDKEGGHNPPCKEEAEKGAGA